MKKISKYKIPIFILVFFIVGVFVIYNFTNKKTSSYAIEDKIEIPDTLSIDSVNSGIHSEDINNTYKGVEVSKIYSNNNQVFSYNMTEDYGNEYIIKEEIKDKGLIYILANSYPNKELKDNNGESIDSDFGTWITQTSIWLYLNKIGKYNLDNNSIYNIKNCKRLYSEDKVLETKNTIYNTYIKDLVNNALKVNKEDYNIKIFNEDKVYSTKDNKYYQSSEIKVITNKSDSFKKYLVSNTSNINGLKIVDSEGREIDENTPLDVTDSFYVRIPKNDNNKNKTATIKITGIFDKYIAYIFSLDNYKDLIYGGRGETAVDNSFDIKF